MKKFFARALALYIVLSLFLPIFPVWASDFPGGGGGSFSGGTLTSQITWATGLGNITHVLGPTDRTFTIRAAEGSANGNDLNLWGGAATGTKDAGGLGLSGGQAQTGSGGSVAITGGTATVDGDGGSIQLFSGSPSGTDNNPGYLNLVVASGTGTGYSQYNLQTSFSGATGSSNPESGNSYDRHYVTTKRLSLSDNTATTFATFTCSSGQMNAVTVHYTIRAGDGTDFQVESGMFTVAAVNKGGTVTSSVSSVIFATQAVSSGTLTVTASVTNTGSTINMRIAANTSLTPTTLDIAWQALANASTTITPQ
jgi:hypothetical protein